MAPSDDLAVATATAEASVVTAAPAQWLWRFARRRAVDITLLVTVGILGVVLVPELAPLAAAVGVLVTARLARVARAAAPVGS